MIPRRIKEGGATRLLLRAAAALLLFAAGAAAGGAASAPAPAESAARWVHAYAAFGAPKYGPDFRHFDYVNPAAPKGGTLHLRNPDRRQNFDK